MTATSKSPILMTSLAEIASFWPCASGWRDILKGQNKVTVDDELFPLVNCCESNSVSDVLWLIGERAQEIKIAVRFAAKCAASVAHLNRGAADAAAVYAAYANAYANAYAAAYAADAADAYAAAYAAADAAEDAADAAVTAAAEDAAYAAEDAAYAARVEQNRKNKQFLIDCINEYPFSSTSGV